MALSHKNQTFVKLNLTSWLSGQHSSVISGRSWVQILAWSPAILRFFMVFFSSIKQMPEQFVNQAMTTNFQLIHHPIIHYYIVWVTDNFIK